MALFEIVRPRVVQVIDGCERIQSAEDMSYVEQSAMNSHDLSVHLWGVRGFLRALESRGFALVRLPKVEDRADG